MTEIFKRNFRRGEGEGHQFGLTVVITLFSVSFRAPFAVCGGTLQTENIQCKNVTELLASMHKRSSEALMSC